VAKGNDVAAFEALTEVSTKMAVFWVCRAVWTGVSSPTFQK
jgi:hypothetical protein